MVSGQRLSIISAISIAIVFSLTVFFIFMWANKVEGIEPTARAIVSLAAAFIFGLLLFKFFGTGEGKPIGLVSLAGYVVGGFIAIKLISVALLSVSLVPIEGIYVAMMAAICESWFIHAGLQTFFIRIGGGLQWASVPVASAVACFYHWAVYGTSMVSMIYVFAAFCVLCSLYVLTKRLEVPMLVHLLINLVG